MNLLLFTFIGLFANLFVEGRLGLNVDYSVFRHSERESYLEIFYSLQKSKFLYEFKNGRYNISAYLRLDVINIEKDSTLIRKGWKVETSFDDTSKVAGEDIVDVLRFYVPSGKYRIIMRALDLHNTQNYDSVSFDVNVPVFDSKDKLMISSLEFCYSISKSTDTTDVFYKNSYRVVPNPTALYGLNVPVLYYYFELYNVLSGVKGEQFHINISVLDNNQNKVPDIRERKFVRNKVYNSVVEVGTVNVNMLPTGIYYLDVVISEVDGSILAENRRKFFIYNPSVAPRIDTSSITAELLGIDEKSLDDEFSKAVYISTQEEASIYSQLKGVDAKRRFLGAFWARRGGVEFRKKYLERVEQANVKFATRLTPGWRTDRGRVYIIYGPPDEVERYPYSENMKPYEIWHYYNLQGGVIFVFGDRTGFGSYELLHSTLVGEIKNEEWMYLLMQR